MTTQLKENRDVLRELEFLFKAQFNLGNMGIAIISSEKSWLRVNPKLCQMLGYSEQELMQRTWAEMTYPQDLEPDLIQFHRLLTREIDSYELEKRFIRKDGSLVYAHLTVTCYRDAGEIQFVIAGLLDITERKQAELKLQALILRNQILMDNATESIHITDDKGYIIDANKAFCQRLGYSYEEALKLHVSDWDVQYSSEQIADTLQQLFNGGMTFESKYKRKDGIVLDVEINAVGVELEGKKCIYASVRDITECKQMEQALQVSEHRLNEIINLMPVAVFVKDAQSRVTLMNHVCELQWGISFAQIQNTVGRHIFPAAQIESFLADDKKIFDNGQVLEVEEQVWNAQLQVNRTIHTFKKPVFNLAGNPDYLIGICIDITERKQMEQELRDSEHRLNEAQRIAQLGNWELDFSTNTLRWSDSVFLIFEIDKKQFPATFESFIAAIHPDDRDKVSKAYTESLQTRQPYHISHRLLMPDGRIKYIHEQCITYFDSENKPIRSIGTVQDITERTKLEEDIKRLSESELNKARLEAEKANRAKSEFLSSMSHELRTPMNAVLGFAQLLEMEGLTEEQMENVQEILTAGRHLLDLINEVLDLAKIESEKLDLNLEKLDLKTEIKNCLTLMQPLIAKNNITIVNNFCTVCTNCNDSIVIADKFRLKQVLLNLISNAIKYNRPNGSVTLSCTPINRQILKVSITDTGNGLSEAELAKLFQPFERLSAKNSTLEGTGVGLVISKKLIEAMNGRIGVESTKGKGSCFWIEIPLA